MKDSQAEPTADTPTKNPSPSSELSITQFTEWIRQNFFGELSDSEFGQRLEQAKATYVRVKAYLEEHELSFSLRHAQRGERPHHERRGPESAGQRAARRTEQATSKPEARRPRLPSADGRRATTQY